MEAWKKSYIRRFDENFSITKDDIFVDIGTGSGYMAIEMAKRGLQVVACDLTLASLLKLKEIIKDDYIKNNLFLICCTADTLPLKRNIEDYLVSNAVLEHIPKEQDAIKEINRVCKKKSGLMITVPLLYKILNPILIPLNIIHDKKIGHLRRYDKRILKKNFSGWEIRKVYYTGHFLKVIKTISNLLFNIFDKDKIEKEDQDRENIEKGASNICVIMKR